MDTVARLEQDFIKIQQVEDAGDILIGSHVLICSIMTNVLTEHPNCIIPYVSIGALMDFLPTLPIGPPFYLSTVSFTSILIAVLMSMVAISLGWTSPHLQAFPPVPTIQYACLAIADIVFTYAGYVVFFLFSELEDIDALPNALVSLHSRVAILYKPSAIAIHAFVGNEAIPLALSAVGKLHRQISISYGIATPALVVGVVVTAHVVVKLIYLRMVCDINSMHNRSYAGRGTWAVSYASLYIVSWVITEGIPISKDRLNVGSLPIICVPSNLPLMFRLYVKRNSSFLTQKQMMTLFVNLSILTLMLLIVNPKEPTLKLKLTGMSGLSVCIALFGPSTSIFCSVSGFSTSYSQDSRSS